MFREKYRRDNELLKAPKEIPGGIIDMTKEKTGKKKGSKLVAAVSVAVAACLVIAVAAVYVVPLLGRGSDLPLTETVGAGDLLRAPDDYSDIYQVLKGMRTGGGYYSGYFGSDDMIILDGAVSAPTTSAPLGEVAPEEEEAEIETDDREFGDYSDSTVTDSFNGAADSAAGTGSSSSADYSQTNTQKENVDEADIIKTDGKYIYRLTNGEIVIIDALQMQVVSRISTDNGRSEKDGDYFYAQNIYVSGDRLVVEYTKEVRRTDSEWWYDSYTGVMVYDITDRSAPVLTGDCAQSGYLADSRLIGDYVYMVTSYSVYNEINEDEPSTYVPMLCVEGRAETMPVSDICVLAAPSASTYAVVTSVNINDAKAFESVEATFGCSSTVYADTEMIVLCYSEHDREQVETTENGANVIIERSEDSTNLIGYSISDGSIELTASGTVPGSLLNQFSLDRHEGVLRVVTTRNMWQQKIYTDGIDRYEYESSTTNGLYVLDGSMNIIGTLDGLAKDERVYSVRFSGDIGYFVTFRQMDPLFAVDLSDPQNPTLLSALKIPGFSQYMHPYADGLLFGLGMDADPETGATNGLKLTMFDVSDPADVTEKDTLLLDEYWWSEALYNHKAAMISSARDIIAFPIDDGYHIYGYGEDGFYERYVLKLPDGYWGYSLRGLFIGDSFYICSAEKLYRYSLADFTLQSELSFAA